MAQQSIDVRFPAAVDDKLLHGVTRTTGLEHAPEEAHTGVAIEDAALFEDRTSAHL
jgi:hypothetical protein